LLSSTRTICTFSNLERTPAEKPRHDVLALRGSAFVQVARVLPNFQPLFECEFERNAAAFGAKLVLVVFLFPFAHVEWYWLPQKMSPSKAAFDRLVAERGSMHTA
jgi:hypothetical protein